MSKEIKNFIHSLSTTPFKINCYNISGKDRLFGNIWFYSLSVAYIKKLGLRINLHTDELGKMALDHLPYDEIFVDCEDLDKEIHPRFWAAAKFVAMRNEGIDTIHIDGDVFIKNGDIIKDIAESDWDVLVQSYEKAETKWYTSLDEHFSKYNSLFNEKYCFDCLSRGAYNTGIVGFRDKQLFKQFVEGYCEIAKYFSEELKELLNSSNTITPDLLIEQNRLFQNCKTANVKMLLKGDNPKELSDFASKLGYQHVCSPTKFNFIEQLKNNLKNVDSDIYYETEQNIKKLEKLLT